MVASRGSSVEFIAAFAACLANRAHDCAKVSHSALSLSLTDRRAIAMHSSAQRR